MLPNESFLQVLHFADYKTLVLTKLAGARFHRLAVKYAEELARRRNFRVEFHPPFFRVESWKQFERIVTYEYIDMTIDARGIIRFERGNKASLEAACREVAEVIGPHAVTQLMFSQNTWYTPGFGVVFEAAPLLRHAGEVTLYGHSPCETIIAANSEAFMTNFVGMKWLRLCLDNEAVPQYSWTFLRQESGRELRRIKLIGWPSIPTEDMSRSVEELVGQCVTLPRGGEALELDFSVTRFSGAFGLRIIDLLKNPGRELTFRMSTHDDGLILDESEYTFDVDGTTTRYASQRTGIVVEVKERCVTIQSPAEVPRKKPRSSGEVLQ